jgi:Protein of unknown function (DUF2842)
MSARRGDANLVPEARWSSKITVLAEAGADHIVGRARSQTAPANGTRKRHLQTAPANGTCKRQNTPMPLRIRKLIGAVALIVLVLSWSLVAMAIAQFPVVKANGLVETIYYAVAGLGWVLPAMPLVRWMSGIGAARSIKDDQPVV